MRTDVEIQRDVFEELEWDARVEQTDVGVEVDEGIVTLTGTVSNYAKKLAAQEAAHRVAGVRDVANDVRVHTPIRFGIDSISVNPDAIEQTRYHMATAERRLLLEGCRRSD